MINYNRYRAALELTYEDTCTVYRYQDNKDPVSKVTKQIPVAVYDSQACRLSQSGLAKDGQTEAQNDIQYDAKLFIFPDIAIRAGDLILVIRKAQPDEPVRFVAGEPFPSYPTHQEIGLTRKEWA
ncbi:ABC transporter ATP-binding protein [Paenibacillus sp. HN-1]|uniref:ABC transporter ATP-binding protein n=1 Tax=Paenibacillus TaxID=44249 RepID=UPI001CA990D3|nr:MULTISPECIES: ABC transporter ATP-binding protein [Paenibacillus]MBY9078302.1 ABC transporter ATP-binding protein [Paenibacillus sp. CGMCC 1.18879]MBY9086039.1 ABC transporter ATP-binding protein [Paenibacillus sinensis]